MDNPETPQWDAQNKALVYIHHHYCNHFLVTGSSLRIQTISVDYYSSFDQSLFTFIVLLLCLFSVRKQHTNTEFYVLGYNAVYSAERLLATCFTPVSCVACSSTLKVEGTFSSGTSADFQLTGRRYKPEDRNLHNHRCENLKSYDIRIYCFRTRWCVLKSIIYIFNL
jgi:hypothetical protein